MSRKFLITKKILEEYLPRVSVKVDDYCMERFVFCIETIEEFNSSYKVEELYDFIKRVKANAEMDEFDYENQFFSVFDREGTQNFRHNAPEKTKVLRLLTIVFLIDVIGKAKTLGLDIIEANCKRIFGNFLAIFINHNEYESKEGFRCECLACLRFDFQNCPNNKIFARRLRLKNRLRQKLEEKRLLENEEKEKLVQDEEKLRLKKAEKRRRQKEKRLLQNEEQIVFNPSLRHVEIF